MNPVKVFLRFILIIGYIKIFVLNLNVFIPGVGEREKRPSIVWSNVSGSKISPKVSFNEAGEIMIFGETLILH